MVDLQMVTPQTALHRSTEAELADRTPNRYQKRRVRRNSHHLQTAQEVWDLRRFLRP